MEFIKKYKLLLFIFLFLFFIILIFIYFSYKLNIVQAVSSEIKIEFDIIGNEEKSKNKEFSVIVPDNGFEEWNEYIWKNEIEFSDNVMNISGYNESNENIFRIYISKNQDDDKLNKVLNPYDRAAENGEYTKRQKLKIGDIKVYFYEKYINIDTRNSYQYIFEKSGNIYLIEGSFRIGEKSYFDKIIRQIVLSIK